MGSYAAECLARSGVGELTLVDSDTIALTNLNRQLEALHSTLGQPKAEAVAARLRDINPDAELHPVHGLYDAAHRDRFFPEGCRYDYIVDAIDLVSCKLDLAETALKLNIPLIAALGTGNKLDPTLLQVTDISKTYGWPPGPGDAQGTPDQRHSPSEGGVQPGEARLSRPAGDAAPRPPQCARQQSLGSRHSRSAARQRCCAGPDCPGLSALLKSSGPQFAGRCFMESVPYTASVFSTETATGTGSSLPSSPV